MFTLKAVPMSQPRTVGKALPVFLLVVHCHHFLSPYPQLIFSQYYAYMGTSCGCGNGNEAAANWQGNTGAALGIGQGYYSGAVNQVIFQGSMSNGSPYCGPACGICYELQTTGQSAYGGSPGPGSTIVIMVVDSCYNNNGAPNWCSSTSGGPDDFGCTVHFDIDTDPNLGSSSPPVPVGQDGTQWANGGEFVQYRQTACPPAMASAFSQDCAGDCAA